MRSDIACPAGDYDSHDQRSPARRRVSGRQFAYYLARVELRSSFSLRSRVVSIASACYLTEPDAENVARCRLV